MTTGQKLIFISYNRTDRLWAEWIAWQLEAVGHRAIIQAWDIRAGQNFVLEMQRAVQEADLTIAVLSHSYLDSKFTSSEWTSAFIRDPKGKKRTLVPVRVSKCQPDGILGPIAYVDLVGEENPVVARNKLLDSILEERGKPEVEPFFPGFSAGPEFPRTRQGQKKEGPTASMREERLPGTRRSHPSKFWSYVKGAIDLWLQRDLLSHLLEDHRRAGIEQPLPSLLQEKITIPFRSWASRPTVSSPDKLGMIIIGLPGAGKTRWLDEVYTQQISRNEVVLRLEAHDLKLALSSADHQVLWNQIVDYYWRQKPVGFRRHLTPAAISCALSRRKVLIVIEDIHVIGDPSQVMTFLREYFEVHHRWGDHLTLLATMRRLPSRRSTVSAGQDFEVVELKPLDRETYEPQQFFLDICEANGFEIQVSEIGEALAKGFSTETTCSPLFIVICAWLAITRDEYKRELPRLFRLHAADIFENFVDELFRRALSPELKLASFKQAYAELTISLWPRWRDFTEADMESALQRSKSQSETVLTLNFLEQNGFLFRTQAQFGAPRWSFPHQSMADYLASNWMLKSHDFEPLRRRLDNGILSFLADMVEGPDVLMEIAEGDFSAFINAVETKPDLLVLNVHPRDKIAERTAGIACSWVSVEAPMRLEVEVWLGAGGSLVARWHRWRDLFCEFLPENMPSPAAIEALAALSGSSCEKQLCRWLADSHSWRTFLDSVHAKPVVDFLVGQVIGSGFSTGIAKTSLDILAKRGDYRALRAIGDACSDMLLNVKRAISSRLASKIGHALIPKGRYAVVDGERKPVVELAKTFLIPCAAKSIAGSFGNKSGAVLRIAREVTESSLMTWEQALVVHTHFRHAGPVVAAQGGVLFGSPEDAYYEAFRTGVSGISVFYEGVGAEGKGRRLFKLRATSTEQPQAGLFITGPRYREIIVP